MSSKKTDTAESGADGEAGAPERELTGQGTHVAVERGYAKGILIERGEPVPAGVAVSLYEGHPAPGYHGWMAPKEEAEEALAETEE